MQHRALCEDLAVFRLRQTVGDDAGTRLVAVGVAVKHQGADRDRLVHVAAVTEVADRAAVEPAPHGLDLVDQLHCAHLRCAHQRTGGKRGGEQVERVAACGEAARDTAHEVHDVAVTLDRSERTHFDRSRRRHPAEVVAREVDQHHVLGVFLRVGEQFCLERGVMRGIRAARPRPGNRTQLRLSTVELDQRLGRGADDHPLA